MILLFLISNIMMGAIVMILGYEIPVLMNSKSIVRKITTPDTIVTIIIPYNGNYLLRFNTDKLPPDHCVRIYHSLNVHDRPKSDCIAGQPTYVVSSGDVSVQLLIDETYFESSQNEIMLTVTSDPIQKCNGKLDMEIDFANDALVIINPSHNFSSNLLEIYKAGNLIGAISADDVSISIPLDYFMDHEGVVLLDTMNACFAQITLASITESLRGNNIFRLSPMIMDISNTEWSSLVVGYPKITPEPPKDAIALMSFYDNFGQCLSVFSLFKQSDQTVLDLAGGFDDCGVYTYRLEATLVMPNNAILARNSWIIGPVHLMNEKTKTNPWSGCHYAINTTSESLSPVIPVKSLLLSEADLSRDTIGMIVEIDTSSLPRMPSDHETTVRAYLKGIDPSLFNVLTAKLDGREYIMSDQTHMTTGKIGEFTFQTRYGITHTLSMIGYIMLPDSNDTYTLRQETPQLTLAPLPPIYAQLQLPVTYIQNSNEIEIAVDVSVVDLFMIMFKSAPDVYISRDQMTFVSLNLPSGYIHSVFFRLKRFSGDFHPRYGTMELIFNSLHHPVMIDGVDAAISNAIQGVSGVPSLVENIENTSQDFGPAMIQTITPVTMVPSVVSNNKHTEQKNKDTVSLITTASQGISTGSIIARLCSESRFETLEWILVNSIGLQFHEQSSVYATSKCTNIIYTGLRPGVYYFRAAALNISEITVIKSAQALSVLQAKQVLQCPGKGMIMAKAVDQESTRTRFLDSNGVLDTLDPGTIFGFTKPGKYAVELVSEENNTLKVIGADGLMIIEDAHYGPNDFVFSVRTLPSCGGASDGIIFLALPPELQAASVEPFMQFAATVFTGANVDRITITQSSESGYTGFMISNLPLLRYMIVKVTVNRVCSFTLRYDVPLPDDYYPMLHSLKYQPVCTSGSNLARARLQAYAYDPVSDSNNPKPLLGNHELLWTFTLNDYGIYKYETSNSTTEISAETIQKGGKVRLDLRYGKCSTQTELIISPETTPLRRTPTIMIEEILPIFCPRRNDSQVRVRIAPVSGAYDGVLGDLFMDNELVSPQFINPMNGIVTLIDLGPGKHVLEYRLNDHDALECVAQASFVIYPKPEYVLSRHIEIDEDAGTAYIDFTSDNLDVPEVTHFYADMFNDPDDRRYLVDNGHGSATMSGMPAGHVVSIDIPYPQPPSPTYIRHASQYCPEPLIIRIPKILPPTTLREYDREKDVDWEIYVTPVEQRLADKELPSSFMINARDRNFGTYSVNEGITLTFIPPTELAFYLVDAEPNIPRYTYAIPNKYQDKFGGPESFMVSVVYDRNRNALNLIKRAGVTEPIDSLTFVVVRAESPVPESYAIHQNEYKFSVAAMGRVDLAAYIHGLESADENVHFYVDGKICNLRATGFSYWSYKCLFTIISGRTMSGTNLYLGLESHFNEIRRDSSIVSRKSTILTSPVFPLKLVCSATALPSSPIAEDGNITIMISGGVAPYLYVWSDLPTTMISGNTLVRTGVGVGVYSVSVMDSALTASFEYAQTCIIRVEDAPSVYTDFYLSGVFVSPPVGCSTNASTVLIIGVTGTVDPHAVATIAAWNVNASETAITSCGDYRLQSVQIIGMSVNVTVGTGRWNVAACIDGTLVSTSTGPGEGTDVFVDPSPLSAVVFSSGEICIPDFSVPVVKLPPMIMITSAIYDPLMIVRGSGTNVDYWISNETARILALDTATANMSNPGTYSLWLEDARECPTSVVISMSDTGLAPCGTCYINDTSCYGCDGVPNSGVVYDVCGVCNGTNACLASCTITPLTNISFAPAEIFACVAAGRTVTGIDAPLIELPVILPTASTINIERVPMRTLYAPSGGIGVFTSLVLVNNFTTGLQTTNLITSATEASIPSAITGVNATNLTITLIGPTAPSPFPIDTITMNVQGGSIANATIISTSAGGQKQLVINFVNVPAGGGPALLIPRGPLAIYFIQTAFARIALNTTTTAPLVFFGWDNSAASGLEFLDLLLPPAQMNDTTALQNLACMYIAESAGAVKNAGHGTVVMNAQSEYCQMFIAGGSAPTPTPVAPYVPGKTASWFLYGIPLGTMILVVFGLILYAVFAT